MRRNQTPPTGAELETENELEKLTEEGEGGLLCCMLLHAVLKVSVSVSQLDTLDYFTPSLSLYLYAWLQIAEGCCSFWSSRS
jgi:hypothetical protein